MPTDNVYRYSYSGSDVRAYAYFEGLDSDLAYLESLQTISISVHEAKGQARALGFKGIRGLAESVRTIAGSMILTVVEDHPLRPLISLVQKYLDNTDRVWGGWSVDRNQIGTGTAYQDFNFNNMLASLLPKFNIILYYVSEAARYSINPTVPTGRTLGSTQAAAELIRGISFIDMGKVTSINDVITEVTYSFIAHDYKPLATADIEVARHPIAVSRDEILQNYLRTRLYGKPEDNLEQALKQLDTLDELNRQDIFEELRADGFIE